MKFKKVILLDLDPAKLEPIYWEKLDSMYAKKVYLPKESTKLKSELADADCVLVNFGNNITKEHIDAAPNLKYIGTFSTAFGKVDERHAASKKIPVCNIPGFSSEAVAEFIFAVILENIRQLEIGKIRGREGNYDESGLTAREIKGKTFGVLGLGSIGSRTAEIAKGFGAHVKYWSRNRKPQYERDNINFVELEDLIKVSDFLVIALAQAPDTEMILNKTRIANLKPRAVIVNIAPMELVDIPALAGRLKKGDITFILDHSDEMNAEDIARISPLKNCIIYPPMAYVTDEAKRAKQEIFIGNMKGFLEGKVQNKVN